MNEDDEARRQFNALVDKMCAGGSLLTNNMWFWFQQGWNHAIDTVYAKLKGEANERT